MATGDKSVTGASPDLQATALAAAMNLDKGKAAGAEGPAGSSSGENVTDMMRRLNLTPQEADPFILEDDGDVNLPCPDWVLVGRVLAPNTLHLNTIRTVVWPAWGNPRGLVLRSLGSNLFLAEFGAEADKLRVAKGGPWRLGKHAILLKDYDPRVRPEDVVFNELPIWLRIMKLDYEMMNAERGKPLAGKLGTVEKVEVDENGRACRGSYLRARVIDHQRHPTCDEIRLCFFGAEEGNSTV